MSCEKQENRNGRSDGDPAIAAPNSFFFFLDDSGNALMSSLGQGVDGQPQRKLPKKAAVGIRERSVGRDPFDWFNDTLNWMRFGSFRSGITPEKWLLSR